MTIIVTVAIIPHCPTDVCNVTSLKVSMVDMMVDRLSATLMTNGTAFNNSKSMSSKTHT